MNDAIVFDTHRFVRNLTASGFTERQAEALANEQVQLLNGNLATKTDLQTVKADLQTVKADLQTVKADLEVKLANLDAKIATSKSDILKWLFAALIAQGGVIVTLIKLL